MDFDVTYQLLVIYSALVWYWRTIGVKVDTKSVIDFKKACDSEIFYNIFTEFGTTK
jgi:hypothetical protein